MITRSSIESELKRLGLTKGDIVLLHSSLASLGKVEGGAETVVQAFLNVLGKEGTFVVPTFGNLGIITEVVKNHKASTNSIHPMASVAAIGRHAREICKNHWKSDIAHAEDTPYTRIAEMGGCVCLMGVDQDRNTTLHTVEELLRLPYLGETAKKTFKTPEGRTVTKSWKFFPGPHRNFIGLDKLLRESGKMKTGMIGGSVVRLIKSSDLIDIALEAGKKDPEFVLCDNPACSDCVRQKAAIFKSETSNESFRLASSTSLAGHYVEEIIDNCAKAGIELVEIDTLRGQSVERMPQDLLKKAVGEFKKAGIEVLALRLASETEKFEQILDFSLSLGVEKIVTPLGHFSAENAHLARKKKAEVVFYNMGMSSKYVSEMLQAMKDCGLEPMLAFSPASFAACGENPFLKSYGSKLRKHVRQLYIEDGLFDGSPAKLEEGNGEIKELISILRCSSFDGSFVLSSVNSFKSSLCETVKLFRKLLAEM